MEEIERLKWKVKLLREGLEWALGAGGWRLLYHSDDYPAIITPGPTGSPGVINEELLEADIGSV